MLRNNCIRLLSFQFNSTEREKHANQITETTSLWKYNHFDDSRELEKADNDNTFVNQRVYYQAASDLTGYWDNGEYGAIEIVDCKVDRMSIRWEGQDTPVEFTLSVDPIAAKKEGASTDPKDYAQSWYVGENGYTMYLHYLQDSTWIYIYKSVSMTHQELLCYIDIQADLPDLA